MLCLQAPVAPTYGQLGLGDTADRLLPVQVGAGLWTVVSGGGYHSLGIASDGTLWAWGANHKGQLGLGDTAYRLVPVQVSSATTWTAVSAGGHHSMAIQDDGVTATLWAWGSNSDGQLGLGDTTDRLTPVQVGADTTWASISAGGYHSMARRADSTLWASGKNDSGQLGVGDITSRSALLRVGSDLWSAISAGGCHTVAHKSGTGTIWIWGSNSDGQLGLGDNTDRVSPTQLTSAAMTRAIAGGNHSSYTNPDGATFVFGGNESGQLGLGDTANRLTPVLGTGGGGVGNESLGGRHSGFYTGPLGGAAIKTWGSNNYGQLGVGDTTGRLSPVTVAGAWSGLYAGGYHSLGIATDGTLWAWGANGSGPSLFWQNFYGQHEI